MKIVELLQQQKIATVNDLADLYAASPETIRRDLKDLERQGKIRRTHGGASLPPAEAAQSPAAPDIAFCPESSIGARKLLQAQEKMAICRRAALEIENHDTIYIDNSSTTLYLAQFIPQNIQVTIVTNSISFVLETVKQPSPNILILLLSGFLNRNNLSLYGSNTLKSSENIYPAKSFISCAAINAQGLITDTGLYETDIRREMLKRSSQVFLLVDHTKFEKSAPYFLSNSDDIDCVVTDRLTPPQSVAFLEEKHIALLYAD